MMRASRPCNHPTICNSRLLPSSNRVRLVKTDDSHEYNTLATNKITSFAFKQT